MCAVVTGCTIPIGSYGYWEWVNFMYIQEEASIVRYVDVSTTIDKLSRRRWQFGICSMSTV